MAPSFKLTFFGYYRGLARRPGRSARTADSRKFVWAIHWAKVSGEVDGDKQPATARNRASIVTAGVALAVPAGAQLFDSTRPSISVRASS